MGDAVFGLVGLPVADICRGMSPGLYTLHYFDLKPLFSVLNECRVVPDSTFTLHSPYIG